MQINKKWPWVLTHPFFPSLMGPSVSHQSSFLVSLGEKWKPLFYSPHFFARSLTCSKTRTETRKTMVPFEGVIVKQTLICNISSL